MFRIECAELAKTFSSYSMQTMDEIYKAALVPASNGIGYDAIGYHDSHCHRKFIDLFTHCDDFLIAGKTTPGGAVNAEKLVSKATQFFPNIKLTVEEVAKTDLVSEYLNAFGSLAASDTTTQLCSELIPSASHC